MTSIVTNISALNAQRNLSMTGVKLGKVLEQLSSGYRINRAADDAAGLGISEKMRAQINGNSQAIRNAQDGISMIQTAEGAMDEVHSILQRIRELGVQASNDTYDTPARDSIATEIDQLRTEIDRIANGTQFNGQSLLTGAMGNTPAVVSGGTLVAGNVAAQSVVAGTAVNHQNGETLAAGGHSATGATFTLDANAQALLGGTGTIAGPANGSAATLTFGGNTLTATAPLGVAVGANTVDFAGTVNGNVVHVTLNYTNVDLTATEAQTALAAKTLVLGDSASNTAAISTITATNATPGATYTIAAVNGSPNAITVSDGTTTTQLTLSNLVPGSNTINLVNGISINMTAAAAVSAAALANDLAGKTITVTGTSGGAALQVGANVNAFDQMTINFNDVRATTAGGLNLANQTVTTAQATALSANVAVDFGTVTGGGGIVGSNDRAQALVYIVDHAITTLNSCRATLGASQNRLEHTVNSLGVAVENLTASESRIRDADVATLSSQMASNQILQQAGTAVLAQANQAAQSIISLLRGQ